MRRNHHALKLVTAPAIEPVTLAEVKTFLRISGSADDSMLTGFIIAARNLVEEYTGRKLITQTWRQFMDAFPGKYNFDSLASNTVTEGKLSEFLSTEKSLDILLYPLQSVTHLKTYDDTNTDYTMPTQDYFVDTFSEPGRISLTNSSNWPQTYLRPIQGIEIEFVCGYGANASDVPYALRQAIMELVGKFYQQRGCDGESESSMPASVKGLLGTYRIYRV